MITMGAVRARGVLVLLFFATARAFAENPRAEEPSKAEVVFDTAAQFYDLRSPSGETVLARRRLTSTLAARANELVDSKHGELSFRARVRFDADFGRGGEETNPGDLAHFVPGFSRTGGDLMYAYLEGRRLFADWLGFRLGRQYTADALGFWSFDGALVRLSARFPVALEIFSGLEQRGGFPFSTGRFEAPGVWRGNRSSFDPAAYPSFEERYLAPAWGITGETTPSRFFHARATYRHVYNTGSFRPDPFSGNTISLGSRTSSERIGLSTEANADKIGVLRAILTYDLFRNLVDSARASADAFVSKDLILGADFEHLRPFFDADSIWNFFAGEPTDTLSGRLNYQINDHWSGSLGGGARIFRSDEAEVPIDERLAAQFPMTGHSFAGHGFMHLRHRTLKEAHGLTGRFNVGEAGDRMGLDLFLSRTLASRWLLDARGSAWHFRDRLREEREAVSLGTIASVGYRITERTTATIEDQIEFNRLVGVRNRLVVWLAVGVDP